MRILITGGNGFIGRALALSLAKTNSNFVSVTVHNKNFEFPDSIKVFQKMALSNDTDWSNALENVDIVIHCAGIAHSRNFKSDNSINHLLRINKDGTKNLAEQAAKFGIKRFIFLSTLAVNGYETDLTPFTECDAPNPVSNYAISKMAAEMELKRVSKITGMPFIIIRPPLVYGPNAPGKFGLLFKYLNQGFPNFFSNFYNKRSFIYLDNLLDIIILCIDHPNALNEIFLVSDGEDISINELVSKIIFHLEKSQLVMHIPTGFIFFIFKILGKEEIPRQLVGSLRVDIKKIQSKLNWKPKYSVEQAIFRMVNSSTKCNFD